MTRQTKHDRAASDLLDFLPPERVREICDSLANQFVTVDFVKNNGVPRTYNGQLRAASRLVGNERGQAQGEAMRARGQVWIALPNGQSKSFYIDRVTGIRARGLDIRAGAQ